MSLVSPCLGCPHYKEVEDCFKRLDAILKSQDKVLKKLGLASDFCDYLNKLLKIDGQAVQELLSMRVTFDIDDTEIPPAPSVRDGDKVKIGLLGIINGFLLRHGNELIVAVVDVNGKRLQRFQVISMEEMLEKDKAYEDGRMWLKFYEEGKNGEGENDPK